MSNSCYNCIFRITDYDCTHCRESSKVILDEFGEGDCSMCTRFREDTRKGDING